METLLLFSNSAFNQWLKTQNSLILLLSYLLITHIQTEWVSYVNESAPPTLALIVELKQK